MIDSQLSLPSEQMEALLVHQGDTSLHLQLGETPLSQTISLSIGRQAGAHLLIDEASVSRRHAIISYINKQYMVQELGSTNGTFVNNQQVELARPHIIRPNDILRIGNSVTFKFLLRPPRLENQTSASQKQIAQERPVLNQDGTLSSPGIDQPVPASVVATFKKIPALIILPPSSNGAISTPPWVYLLKPNRLITIGRERGNVIELSDPIVSRRHAELFLATNGCYIRDLGSSNGIIINRVRIARPSQLSHGDRIKIGETILFFIDLQAGYEQTEKNSVPARSVDYHEQNKLYLDYGMVRTPLASHSALENNTSYTMAIHNGAVKNPLEAYFQYNEAKQDLSTRRVAAIRTNERKVEVVICSRCGVANTPVARFCASCSIPLMP